MQAAANRAEALVRAPTPAGTASRRAGADHETLLNALPIASAVIARGPGGAHNLVSYNQRFANVVAASTCPGIESSDVTCLKSGPIADLLQRFFDGVDDADELEFRDGEGIGARFFRIKLAPLPGRRDGDGKRCLLSLVDRTVEVQAERALRAEMLRDSLTGLPNRLAFTEFVEKAGEGPADKSGPGKKAAKAGHAEHGKQPAGAGHAEHGKQPAGAGHAEHGKQPAGAGHAEHGKQPAGAGHAVLVVDMLRFSRINESMGSLAGDELLITFARRLISALRAGDQLARTGGNEFGVLVSLRRGIDDALATAARIQDVMTAPFKLSELEIRVECAIGVAVMQDGQDAEELFRNAQFAVKQAKAAGKPQVYEPKEASAARRRFSIETELRRALDKDQLKLFYQPLMDLKSGQVAGFEALARWDHEDRGEISPSEFIPVAEESGLILTLGRWAMDKAATTLAEWDRRAGAPLPVHVGVNLSAIQVARDDIASVVQSALKSSGLEGNRLTLELTESSIVQDPMRAQRVFEALKALDATVAMDDFGTGYSSLAYLQRLPIDVLKIDRSFVTGMMVDPDSVAIVRAILSLAEALGMSTTAEGIETVELATTLATLGCASGQGFYFAKPLEGEAAFDYWKSRRKS